MILMSVVLYSSGICSTVSTLRMPKRSPHFTDRDTLMVIPSCSGFFGVLGETISDNELRGNNFRLRVHNSGKRLFSAIRLKPRGFAASLQWKRSEERRVGKEC